jgi:hypothetical protein
LNELWTKITKDIATSPVVAAWFTTVGAVIVALISALVSSFVAHRSVYINTVTTERSRWIEAMRKIISTYSGAAGKISARRKLDSQYEKSADWASDTENLQKLLSDLTLRLNPTEVEAKHLLTAAKTLDRAARIHSPAAFILANEVMVRHAQWVAKAEWERVKQEASGWLATPIFAWRNLRRQQAYNAFLQTDGSLHRLDLIGAGKKDIKLTLARSEMDSYTQRCRGGSLRIWPWLQRVLKIG